jgi:cobalt/nickel transport system permease protein
MGNRPQAQKRDRRDMSSTKANLEESVDGQDRGWHQLVEALDPRIRITCTFALVLAIAITQSLWVKLAALAGVSAFLLATSVDLRLVTRRLVHVEGFMLVLLLMLPFTVSGTEVARIGGFAISDRGLLRAISVIVTVNAAVLTVLALLTTLEPVRLARGLGALGCPARLTHLLFFLVRYLDIFREELAQGLEAMRARGFVPRLSRHTMRSYGNLAGMLLVRSIERAERVDEAMRCRGFDGRFAMRSIPALKRLDHQFATATAAVVMAILVADQLS